jgi:predicted metalloendopeptidase
MKGTMQNYLVWKFVEFEVAMLPSMRDLFQKYDKINGPKATELHCSSQMVNLLPAVTSRVYSELSTLSRRDIDELSTMIGTVLSAWQGMIEETDWIDAKSRENAYAKIAQVARKVAFPGWVMDDAALDKYYERLDIRPDDDPFTMVNKAQRFGAWRQMSTLGQAVDRYSWLQSASVVNAWYRPDYNSITFPAAIMQTPFFNANYPKSVNYGDTGATMGHELGHAFDSNGVFWGPFGGYVPDTWMDTESRAGFDKMAGCVANQYDQYCYPNLPNKPCINGSNTITENVADNGGTIAALRAYKAVLELMGGEPALPGALSKMTNEQVFYISYAHSWCSREDPNSIEYLLNHDVHSPARYRVIGVLQNMPEFASAFQCKAGSYMVPEKHCNVWVKPR